TFSFSNFCLSLFPRRPMQGNRDGSWSLGASGNGGSRRGNGNGVPSGYLHQAVENPVFSNFSVQQQPIRYSLPQFPANFYHPSFPDLSGFSFANANYQMQENSSFHHPQIPHQYSPGAVPNVFLRSHGQSFSLPPQSLPNNDINGSHNRGATGAGAFESPSLKRRRQEVIHGTDVVVNETPKSNMAPGESANSLSVTLPIPITRISIDDSGGSRNHGGNGSSEKSSSKPKRKVEVLRIDKAVNMTRISVIAAGESVSSTRVSRSVLEELQADSWRTLGVNAFIHCYVGARRIVTLHDLEVAICRNKFVDSFEDLELGPLLQHPLVLLYFPSISSSFGLVQITSEEIILFLDSYLNTYMTDDVMVDEFLNFVASKKSVASKDKLGCVYLSFKTRRDKKCIRSITSHHQRNNRKNKPFSIFERADSFALHHKDYHGKHTRFDSSSSDVNESFDYEVGKLNSFDHTSSCPYPFVAEEMKRKKRKAERRSHEKSDSFKVLIRGLSKLHKGDAKQEIPKSAEDSDAKKIFSVDEADFTLYEGALRNFISTWKDTCKELSISTLLTHYQLGGTEVRSQNERAKPMSSFPFVGLLNVALKKIVSNLASLPLLCDLAPSCKVLDFGKWRNFPSSALLFDSACAHHNINEAANEKKLQMFAEFVLQVTSMRHGMCDSKYDNLQTLIQSDTVNPCSGNQVDDIMPYENTDLSETQHIAPPKHSCSVEEIIRRLSLYFEHDLSGEKHISILRRLQTCEINFKSRIESLGWGGFLTFLEKHMLLLPTHLQRFLSRELREEVPLEVHVSESLMTLLLSQASEYSYSSVISRQMVARLLAEQFPSINFKVVGQDSEESITEIISSYKNKSGSRCILFSSTLLGAKNSLTSKDLEESMTVGNDTESRSSLFSSVLDVLLKVPLLSDLNSWCHWDLKFAPNFGPLLGHLNEINSKELLCLVTWDGKIIRTDPSATADSFLEAALQGSAYPFCLHARTRSSASCCMMPKLVLGIVEWINDYDKFCSSFSPISATVENASSSLDSGNVDSDESCHTSGGSGALCNYNGEAFTQTVHLDNPASVIDLIRRDGFGLDSSSSGAEASMLQKQHALLERALHCLSQELYSQDSHFILELLVQSHVVSPITDFYSALDDFYHTIRVNRINLKDIPFVASGLKNADDNKYPEHVEPTLTFILQKTGIFVLNNECGFMPENIRALCDVGRSTKKGSGGYIGKKGIGFKSVFRISDAPEIHSNGFHLKFDISEGQIGYILPTVVPPHDIDSLTSITTVNHIKPLFSDLHPSLLLFLHRLQCIVYRNMLDDSLLVMRKEVVSKNVVKVSCGENSVTWFVASEKLKAANLHDDIMHDSRTRDFILTSSREDVDEDSLWNQWLLSEFPGLFVGALRSSCSFPSFTQNLGKAVCSYMQLVPLVGEVHGFFSSLPHFIISRLRTTNCLLLEGDGEHWVLPCKVLRNWNEKIRVLLKDGLLQEHLALGFLDKDIVFSDSLSRELGIEDYGPKTLVQILSSLSHKKGCLQSMGFAWLSSILTEFSVLLCSFGNGNVELGVDKTLIGSLRKTLFIPLSNGKFTSLDEGAVWLHHDTTESDLGDVFEVFPILYGNLRTIDHSLLLASSVDEKPAVDDLVNMICAIGIQKLSAHEIIKVHILPAFEAKNSGTAEGLMVDYLCFVMTHLRSGYHVCHNERKYIISVLRSKALILSNFGLKQLAEASIHFSEEFENQVNMKKLTKNLDISWHVVDGTYLKHPASKYYACGLKEWRELSITEFYSVSRCEKYDTNLLSPELVVRDWESPELVDLLSLLHKSNGRKGCKYLLEVLDRLWDDCYHDKTTVTYNSGVNGVIISSQSSFMRVIFDSKWIVSSMDNKLHLAKDFYHDCDDVRSILGMNAPYAVPKTKVCLDDALEILEAWVYRGDSFKSSISKIPRFYGFLWNEMADSEQKITEKLHDFPSVFVPHITGSRRNDMISGIFLSLDDVYWNDSVGVLDDIKEISSQISSVLESLRRKTLLNIYPGLHDFFCEWPSFQEYLKILGQFAHYVSPSCAAKAVFKIFLKWSDDLNSGKCSEDVVQFKERLSKLDYNVLPTESDKWVSLHSSFGLLKKRFKKKDNVQFIYFRENSDEEQEVLQTKLYVLMHSLGIPSISEVVKREAKYEGLQDNSVTVSLVNWALPYAQRYIFTLHHDKYTETKMTVYSQVKRLQVFVVEKLCYRNVIPQYDISSKKEFKCSSLL
ncbi:unnamed protein product, partial [Thlaspi arvense]